MPRRSGLTLIELLVVLVILAILTTIAITATSQVIDQGRYDATQRTLQNIQDAIVGPANQRAPDGSLLITGFVADMGNLPQPVDATPVPGTVTDPLRQLWDSSSIATPAAVASNLPPLYGVQATPSLTNYAPGAGSAVLQYPANPPPAGYTSYNNTSAAVPVTGTLACGWRGPYLQLGTGSNGRLLDGWGNPFDSLTQTTTPSYSLTFATQGQLINIVRSRGADNQVDPSPFPPNFSPYNVDLYTPNQLGAPPVTPLASFSDRVLGNVSVVVKSFNTLNQGQGAANQLTYLSDPVSVGTRDAVEIVFFTPVNGILTPVYGVNLTPRPGAPNSFYFQLAPTPGATTPNVTATFSIVTIGPRAVQAFQFDVPSGNVIKRSPLTFLMIPSGGVPTQTLILQ
jgi:prepilin-type N-terminal cleavage/methylation domain-containing protein